MDLSISLKGKKPKEEQAAVLDSQKKYDFLVPYRPKDSVNEALKAQVLPETGQNKYLLKNSEIEHPFDFKILLDLYRQYGFVTGFVDKHVDFIVSSGFYVTSDDENAEKIIAQYLRDVNFDSILRSWLKTALITGNGFMEVSGSSNTIPEELMVLNPCYIYVRRDDMGRVLGYSQIIKANTAPLLLDKDNIIHFAMNTLADSAYGCGIVQPAMAIINHLTKAQTDMHMILSRKANTPYIFTVGVPEKDIIPTQAQLDAIGQNLEYLNNKQEWVVDGSVKVSTVDFGKTGEKFDSVIKHDEDQLFFTFQVPEVLMGRGSVPEGLAVVQMQAWQKRVQSIQSEVEKVIETDLFSRILRAHGLEGVHVEFEWGERSDESKQAEITQITSLLGLQSLNPLLRNELEAKLAELMGFDIDLEDMKAARAKEEQQVKQPQAPLPPARAHHHVDVMESDWKDSTISEWVGFNYKQYVDFILKYVETTNFDYVRATNAIQELAGKLSNDQVEHLRIALKKGINNNWSMQKIADEIKRTVNPQDLYEIDGDELALNKEGDPKLLLSKAFRPITMARTEIVNASNQGALMHYEQSGIEKVRWLASVSNRTCPQCIEMNGKIMTVQEAYGNAPPLHAMCRCVVTAITPLG